MSSEMTGAASAAPTLDELADAIRAELDAIEHNTQSALQHAIAAGEKLHLAKARLDHGEWLPWLEKNFALDQRTARRYMLLSANRTRVSDFSSIREALAALPKKEQKQPRERQRPKDTTPEQATQRLRSRVREVKTKDSRVRPRWTLEDTADVQSLIGVKRLGRESGKRLRELHGQRRAGRTGGIWELQKAIAQAVSVLEFFDLPNLEWDEETEVVVAEIIDDLARHARWNEEAVDVAAGHMGDLGRRRKIQLLWTRAQDPSSTPYEREAAASLAARLERRRDTRQIDAR